MRGVRPEADPANLATIAKEWLRLGVIGFGGPPTHISLLRRLCVERRGWLSSGDFEDAIAATNLLPGPASTQLAIYCAWRLRGVIGGVIGGLCFITPGLVLIVLLASVFLAGHPPTWVLAAAAGAGAAVPAVALNAAWSLTPTSRIRIGTSRSERGRWILYAAFGACAAALFGAFLVLVLLFCGATEVAIRRRGIAQTERHHLAMIPLGVVHAVGLGGLGLLAWTALKVGALSYGGGFVIVPLMQHDVVANHWMSAGQFLNAVALGQLTPGPVVQTVAVVGYAASGLAGATLAAVFAFAPSFLFVFIGGPRFQQIRANRDVTAFLCGASPAVVGAIAGSSVPLGLALSHLWQLAVLAAAILWLFVLRRGVVTGLLGAGVLGVVLVHFGLAA